MPPQPATIASRLTTLAAHLLPHTRTMATSTRVHLTPSTTGCFHAPSIPPDSLSLTSQLLQQNHDNYHMYFNTSGFHNHIAHHLLTILALGATPTEIQRAFNDNNHYQRPHFPVSHHTVQSLTHPDQFRAHLNQEQHFHDYEALFADEIDAANGDWGRVLQQRLFSDTENARTLLARMFAGFYHPIIHLGFGVEFEQPPVIVEALAQAATHDEWPRGFLEGTGERAARQSTSKTLLELVREARADEKVRGSVRWEDGNKVRDGVLKRALPEMVELCSQWRVEPTREDLRRKTAEMINVGAFVAGAAQHASREMEVKFDFFLMHAVNCGVFFNAFLRERNDGWLGNEERAKLLMWKGWSDVAMYVSRGCPELLEEEIREYRPKKEGGWEELFGRVNALHDDGHASKLVRALAAGEETCREYEGEEGFPVQGRMWLMLGHMAVDSVEGAEKKWVRNAGFERAWEGFGKRGRSENVNTEDRNPGGEGYHEVH